MRSTRITMILSIITVQHQLVFFLISEKIFVVIIVYAPTVELIVANVIASAESQRVA